MEFTKGDPALIAKAQSESRLFYGMDGRGATAPGAVVLRYLPHNTYTPWVVHFANTQCGGYHGGSYSASLPEAAREFADRCDRYDPAGELNRHYEEIEA